MTHEETELLSALALMCEQYISKNGELDHQCMTAGEYAVELLVQHGMVTPARRGGFWTNAGKALLNAR